MADWSAGYVSDIGYTHGYYQELNPLRIKLAFLRAGLACPEVGVACELGFGQGLSTNIHAAASITRWHGTDFNPSQAALAREMAEYCGSGAELVDDSFADFSNRPNLPEFDFIALHGIWSWISDENRQLIVEFVRRKLKVGGVLYISYNTLPGWSGFAPMRHLLTAHVRSQGSERSGLVGQIDGALDFGKELLAMNPAYAAANPAGVTRFQAVLGQNKHYVAHEYFNRDWHPMHFDTMAEWLESAKLQYACSAHYTDHFEHLNMKPEQASYVKNIPDRMFRETVRDFMVNQQFRRDYWVKGSRTLTTLEVQEQASDVRVVLTSPRADISYTAKSAIGPVHLSEAIYGPVLDLLADHQPRKLSDIAQAIAKDGINMHTVIEIVMILSGLGYVALAQDEGTVAKCAPKAAKLNAYIESKARMHGDLTYLASPVTGGGLFVDRFSELFAKATGEGVEGARALADYVWEILKSQGQLIIKDGEGLQDPAANIAELVNRAQTFIDKHLPILRGLKIV